MWPLNYFQSTQKELKRDLSKQRDTGGTSERVAACEEYASAPLTDSWVEFDNKLSEDCEKTSYAFKAPLFFEETMEFSPYTKDVEAGSPAICFFFLRSFLVHSAVGRGVGMPWASSRSCFSFAFPKDGIDDVELLISEGRQRVVGMRGGCCMFSFFHSPEFSNFFGTPATSDCHWKVDVSPATRSPR